MSWSSRILANEMTPTESVRRPILPVPILSCRMLCTVLLIVLSFTAVQGNTPPRLINFNGFARAKENSPIGTVIKAITATDQDGIDPISYRIDPNNVETNRLVTLSEAWGDSTTGRSVNVTLKIDDLDRDFNPQERKLLFEVHDGTNAPVYARLTLFVEDINDYDPEFRQVPYRASIKEDALNGTLVFNRTETFDPDTGLGGIVTYRLELIPLTTDAAYEHTFRTSLYEGFLYVNERLDYETVNFYRLILRAIDGGGLNSTTDVIITVEDVQDTPPSFVNLPYMTRVLDNANLGSSVLAVSALDGDKGRPNPITYSFVGDTHGDIFKINSTTGLITVNKHLDSDDPELREQGSVIDLTVMAAEINESLPQNGETIATTLVTIYVDKSPEFDSSTYPRDRPYNMYAREEMVQSIGSVGVAEDKDGGNNSIICYCFLGDHTDFVINITTGEIDLIRSIDREKEPHPRQLVVQASQYCDSCDEVTRRKRAVDGAPDRYNQSDTSMLWVQVNIVDINDNPPVFTIKGLSVAITRDTQYDFEGMKVSIIAQETGTPEKHRGMAAVTVYVIDKNDKYPELVNTSYEAHIPEDAIIDDVVAQITAKDEDSGIFGEISYNIRGGGRMFKVNKDDGTVSVDRVPLDRETLSRYYLNLEAIDGGGLRSQVLLTVILTDVNDNAPKFQQRDYSGYLLKNASTFWRPVVLTATDMDKPNTANSQVKYRLHHVPAEAAGHFVMDESTGELKVTTRLPDSLVTRGVVLEVKAYDGGTPSLSSSVNVTVSRQTGCQIPTSHHGQVLNLELRGDADDVSAVKSALVQTLEGAVGGAYRIIVDTIRHRKYASGEPLSGRTDLTLHAVVRKTNQIVSGDELLRLFESKKEVLNGAYKVYHVVNIWTED